MRQRFHYRFFGYGLYGYVCTLCGRGDIKYASYRDLRRHQFEGPDACVLTHYRPEVIEDPDPPFEGERIPVPAALPSADDLAEHRDSKGRLRVAGTLTGYRYWRVGRVDGSFRLFPAFAKRKGSGPYARGVTAAHCDAEAWDEPHRSPDARCRCGLHADWDPQRIITRRNPGAHATLLGAVKAWGKVLPGENGFRSEFAMVSALCRPSCTILGCDEASIRFVTRPHWTTWMTPGGRTYPRVNDHRHETYRDTADFVASMPRSDYLGWFCDAHSRGDLVPISDSGYRCNYPTTARSHHCARPSTFTVEGLPYSWCHEHAPLVFDTASVIRGLTDYYDVDMIAAGSAVA